MHAGTYKDEMTTTLYNIGVPCVSPFHKLTRLAILARRDAGRGV